MLPFPIMNQYGNTVTYIKNNIASINSTSDALLALSSTGDLYVRGGGANYKLGTGNNMSVQTWTKVLTNVRLVSGSQAFVIVITLDNRVLYCGNTSLVTGTSTSTNAVVKSFTNITYKFNQIFNISSITKLTCTQYCVGMLLNTGELYAYGYDDNYSFGLTTTNKSTPVLVSGTSAVTDVYSSINASGYKSSSLSGFMRSGYSNNGVLGSSSSLTTYTEYNADTGSTLVDAMINEYNSNLLIKSSDGSIKYYSAGKNYYGQLGTANNTSYTSYRYISIYDNMFSSFKQCGTASTYSFAVSADGNNLYACGDNRTNCLGIPSITSTVNVYTLVPKNFSTIQSVIYCGSSYYGNYISVVQDSDGFYYTGNSNAKFGLPDTSVFIRVPNLPE